MFNHKVRLLISVVIHGFTINYSKLLHLAGNLKNCW